MKRLTVREHESGGFGVYRGKVLYGLYPSEAEAREELAVQKRLKNWLHEGKTKGKHMAAKKSRKRAKKSKKSKKSAKKSKKSHAKGHVPLKVLEKRLAKLNAVVKKRGGKHL